MKLHDNEKDFLELINATAESKGIQNIYVEKDYWVTYALKQLSHSPFKDKVIFKGGTSLAKAYNLIHRFSEDIDLVLLTNIGLTPEEREKILVDLENDVFTHPLTLKEHVETKSMRVYRKKFYNYPTKIGDRDFGQVSEHILMELNSFANPDPIEKKFIKSYIAEYLESVGDLDSIKKYELEPVELNILSVSRTFVEKVMCISGASNRDDKEYTDLKSKIRHFYDIHRIIQDGVIQEFLSGNTFHDTIELVYNEDKKDKYTKDGWTVDKLLDTNLFRDLEIIMPQLKSAFEGNFQRMMLIPHSEKFDDVVVSFKKLKTLIPDQVMKLKE